MAIVGRTATVVEQSSSQSVTGTLPSDRQSGDLCVAVFAMSSTTANFTGPAGWTQIHTPTASGSTIMLASYYRFDPPGNPTGSTTDAASRQTAIVQAYGNVDSSTPIDVAAAVSTSTTTALTITGITTVTNGARLISGVCANTASRTWTEPASMTSVAEYSATTNGRAGALADEVDTTAGATGTRSWDMV